jgi:hypothetical protein
MGLIRNLRLGTNPCSLDMEKKKRIIGTFRVIRAWC